MKKLLSLTLALAMVLCAAAALAEGTPSIETAAIEQAKTDVETIKVVSVPDTPATQAIKETLTAGGADKVLDAVPAAVKASIPAEYKNVNEISTQRIEGDLTGVTSLKVSYTFTVPYKPGEKVYLLVAVPGENGEIEWVTVEGEADADGNVAVTYDETLLSKLGNDEFLVIPVNK